MAQLLDMLAGKPRKPLLRSADSAVETHQTTVAAMTMNDSSGRPIDSDESLRDLMEAIYRSPVLSDTTRIAIADAIARHLGVSRQGLANQPWSNAR